MSEFENGVGKDGITSLTIEGTVESQGKYTRIRVNAQDEAGGQLLYAIDSDAPEAFNESNEFTVEKGSKHIVYVKDAAGNISSQLYQVSDEQLEMVVNTDNYQNTQSVGELPVIEDGGGSMAERVITNNDTDAERVFYTVKTKDEHVFYLVIDQSRDSNNVYLLNQVDAEDLYAFTGEEDENESQKEDIFSIQNTETPVLPAEEVVMEKKKDGDGVFLFIVLGLLSAAAFYYYKIYRPKQQKIAETSDAKELDEFEPEEEEEVLDFTVSKEEKEELMNQILNNNDIDEELTIYKNEENGLNDVVDVEDDNDNRGYAELELPEEDEL